MDKVSDRREWWITNPPWCWKWTLVSCFQGREKEGEDVVHVKEVKPDDPDMDEMLAAIDQPVPVEINTMTFAEAAKWILNVRRARCHTGNLSQNSPSNTNRE